MSDPKAVPNNSAMLWTGRVISTLIVLMLLLSAVTKFTASPQLIEGFSHLDWPMKFAIALGVTELACTILYAIPQTSVLGAILLTGYMGGAIATHSRIGEWALVQAGIGVLIWLALFLRGPRLRALLPLRS